MSEEYGMVKGVAREWDDGQEDEMEEESGGGVKRIG